MELLGVKNIPSDYSSGFSLFSDAGRDFVPSGSWDTAAMIFKNGSVIEMPLEAYKGKVKAFDSEYVEIPGGAARFTPYLIKFQKEAVRFYRN